VKARSNLDRNGKRIRASEEFSRRIVERELKRPVVINDDGSAPGMYDLRVGPADAPEVAIECVGAVDSTYTETWNLGPAKGPLQLSISGDWIVEIAPTARVKTVRERIEQLLQVLESQGLYNVNADYELEGHKPVLFNTLNWSTLRTLLVTAREAPAKFISQCRERVARLMSMAARSRNGSEGSFASLPNRMCWISSSGPGRPTDMLFCL
jgi:hypothetical protein